MKFAGGTSISRPSVPGKPAFEQIFQKTMTVRMVIAREINIPTKNMVIIAAVLKLGIISIKGWGICGSINFPFIDNGFCVATGVGASRLLR